MGKPNVSTADGDLVHVPPSQQSCQGPVPKPGEPLVPGPKPEIDPRGEELERTLHSESKEQPKAQHKAEEKKPEPWLPVKPNPSHKK